MSDSKNYKVEASTSRRSTAGDASASRGKSESWEAYSTWLNRAQKGGGRHSAITRNLNSWSNYKSWADKVRSSWDDDK
jgi:hypothetical protein